jgi:hypothetical protein
MAAFAQKDTAAKQTPLTVNKLPRSKDHFMFQLGYNLWQGKPDSIATKGLPHTTNIYLLFDFPFKSNPKLSAAIGAGIGIDQMYFDKMYVGIKDNTEDLVFRDLSDTTHFKKYKMATTYLEAPVELRYSANPEDNNRSFKAAIGVKVGTTLSAMVKGKNLEDRNENSVLEYTSKEKSKRFFESPRISGTVRVGYGVVSLFGSYAFTPLFKEGTAPSIHPIAFGLTLSGL